MGRDTVEGWRVIKGRVRIVHMSGKMVLVQCVLLRTIFQLEGDCLCLIKVSLSLIWTKGDDIMIDFFMRYFLLIVTIKYFRRHE